LYNSTTAAQAKAEADPAYTGHYEIDPKEQADGRRLTRTKPRDQPPFGPDKDRLPPEELWSLRSGRPKRRLGRVARGEIDPTS
jgi:hypothetical protein